MAAVVLVEQRLMHYASNKDEVASSMAKQLNIGSDEAHRLAHIIAERLNQPLAEVVLQALREFGAKLPSIDDFTPTQRAEFEALRELSREAATYKRPGDTSDHSDMYDEFGLPR